MTLPQAAPARGEPTKWTNGEGLGLRLQCFLTVRDGDRRVACVRLKANPELWMLPGETVQPNEDIHAAARRVSELWFGEALETRLADVLSYPDDGDGKWYVLFVYEAQAPSAALQKPDDTEDIAFAPVGKPPGPFGMDHGSVFERLKP